MKTITKEDVNQVLKAHSVVINEIHADSMTLDDFSETDIQEMIFEKVNEIIVFCPDCNQLQPVEKDPCPIHKDCEDYAWMCSVCGSLNVDYEARGNK